MKPLTTEEIAALANEFKLSVEARTCCTSHACDVLLTALAGFMLSGPGGNEMAAKCLLAAAAEYAGYIRAGAFLMARRQ